MSILDPLDVCDSMTIRWRQVDSFPGNRSSVETMELRPCPICGSDRFRTVLQFDQFQFYSDSNEVPKRVGLRQVQCLDCFALYLNPCYSNYGFSVLFAEAGASYGSAVVRPKEQIGWLADRGLLGPGARVLDAGCYDGSFLAKFPKNVEKIGVDIDEPAIARGRKAFGNEGIEFIVGDFENFRFDKPLDVITMFHVLEHLPRPVAVLRHVRSMAHPEAKLVVEVPTLQNGITNDINGFFSVQHMTHFSRTSLQNCLTLAGWKILECQEQPDYNGYRVMAGIAQPSESVETDDSATALLHKSLANWHGAVGAVEERLSAHKHGGRWVIWGGGVHGEFLYQTTSFFRIDRGREYAIVDSDSAKRGKSWRGIEIHSPEVLRDIPWSDKHLLISSYGSQPNIVKAAAALQVPSDRVVTLYDHLRVY